MGAIGRARLATWALGVVCAATAALELASCSEYSLYKDTDKVHEDDGITWTFELVSAGAKTSDGVRVCQLMVAGIVEDRDLDGMEITGFEVEGLSGSTYPDGRRVRVAAWDLTDGKGVGRDPDYLSDWVDATDAKGAVWLAEGDWSDLGTLTDCPDCTLAFLPEIELLDDTPDVCDGYLPAELRIFLDP